MLSHKPKGSDSYKLTRPSDSFEGSEITCYVAIKLSLVFFLFVFVLGLGPFGIKPLLPGTSVNC